MTGAAHAGAPAVPRRRGWIFWGTLVFLLVLLALLGAMAYWVYRLYGYTSPEPRPVPVYAAKPGEAEAVEARVEAFRLRPEGGGPGSGAARLELSADDLNALVAGSRDGARYAGKVFFRAEGDALYADVSLPLSGLRPLGLDLFSGRYLVGTIALKAVRPKESPGRTILAVDSVVAGGRALPETYLSHLRGRDLLESLAEGGWKSYLEGVRSISIRDGRIALER